MGKRVSLKIEIYQISSGYSIVLFMKKILNSSSNSLEYSEMIDESVPSNSIMNSEMHPNK